MKKITFHKLFGTAGALLLALFFSCTKLEDQSYNEIVAEQFTAGEDDIISIIGSAYGGCRNILLLWNGYCRVQEVGADEIVIPARPNGWVDGGNLSPYSRTYLDNR
jgi:hypothetical protein